MTVILAFALHNEIILWSGSQLGYWYIEAVSIPTMNIGRFGLNVVVCANLQKLLMHPPKMVVESIIQSSEFNSFGQFFLARQYLIF